MPSGIVLGGETVILLVRLPVLFCSPLVSTGDAGASLLGDIVDADVRDAIWRAGNSFEVSVGIDGSLGIARGPSDRFSYDSWVRQ